MQNLTEAKEQLFFCISKDGYMSKIKPRNTFEKQQIYNSFTHYIQLGFRSLDNVKILFSDGFERIIDPNKLRIGQSQFLSKMKQVKSFWLEPKLKNCEVNKNGNKNKTNGVLQEVSIRE